MADEFVLAEVEEKEYAVIPDGEILTAEVVSVEKQVKPWKKKDAEGKDTEEDDVKVSFRFKITEEGEFQGRTVFGETPTTFSTHSECKLRIWVQELLGLDELPAGFKFNTETLAEMPCRVAVGQRIAKQGKNAGRPVNFVADVIRASTFTTAEQIF